MTTKAPKYTVMWTSALSGNHSSSACKDKKRAVREARALFTEGARNISVTKYDPVSKIAVAVDWRK